ncbi:MAG: glutamate--tRNA ligase family protein, partial [Gemmobacter sp.]
MAGVVTRFAPSPTGPLHLGHAYAAIVAHDMARAAGGRFLLRIEDIDQTRCRPAWEAQIYDDLAWLGLSWEEPVMRQSDRLPTYQAALDALWARGVLYPCTCSRRDIEAALAAPQEGAPIAMGPDGPVYPGICRHHSRVGARPADAVLRLDIAAALAQTDGAFAFVETGISHAGLIGTADGHYTDSIGDIVLSRRDMGTSYHL